MKQFIVVAFRQGLEIGRKECSAHDFDEADQDGRWDLHQELGLGLFDETVVFVTVPAPANG